MTSTLPVVSAPTVGYENLNGGNGHDRHLLGVVDFTTYSGEITVDNGFPRVSVHVADSTEAGFAEVWTTRRAVAAGEFEGIPYGHDGEFLFCAFHIPEMGDYTAATERAYAAALELVSALDYRPFRIWHYISRLNEPNAAGLEVYREFCVGRARVLERHGITHDMPAATVVGAHTGGIVCYLLAARAGEHVNLENPRQVPAYHYPSRYGPKSPNFARATSLDGHLYVSGTASILGHRTVHPGDVASQCRLALENVAQVIGPGNLLAHGVGGGRTLADVSAAKVYVRHHADLPLVREICGAALPAHAQVRYLHSAICRSDLLVELEAIVPRTHVLVPGSPA